MPSAEITSSCANEADVWTDANNSIHAYGIGWRPTASQHTGKASFLASHLGPGESLQRSLVGLGAQEVCDAPDGRRVSYGWKACVWCDFGRGTTRKVVEKVGARLVPVS